MGAYTTNSSRCIPRHKVEINARKGKKTQQIKKKKELPSSIGNKVDDKEKEASPQLDTNMKLEVENLAQSPTPAPKYEIDRGPDRIPKGRNHIKKN